MHGSFSILAVLSMTIMLNYPIVSYETYALNRFFEVEFLYVAGSDKIQGLRLHRIRHRHKILLSDKVSAFYTLLTDTINAVETCAQRSSAVKFYKSSGSHDIWISKRTAVFKLPSGIHWIFHIFLLRRLACIIKHALFWDTFYT